MPRLRDETYAARRRHIVDAARRCFARKGFDGTSMLDLQREAGVSAGALYVYFPRKADIVDAAIDDSIERFARACAEAAAGRTPLRPTLLKLLRQVDADATGPAAGFGFHLWAETVRDDRVASRMRDAAQGMCADLALLAERAVADGDLAPGTDVEAAGRTIFRAAYGYYAQRIVVGDITPAHVTDSLLGALRADPAYAAA